MHGRCRTRRTSGSSPTAGGFICCFRAFFGDGLKRRLDDDPRLRVSLDGKLYEQIAVAVSDSKDLAALVAPVIRRQFAIEISGEVRPVGRGAELWIYRLEDPPPAGAGEAAR
jgi:hypothetical protein